MIVAGKQDRAGPGVSLRTLGRTSHLGLWTDVCSDEAGRGSTQAHNRAGIEKRLQTQTLQADS